MARALGGSKTRLEPNRDGALRGRNPVSREVEANLKSGSATGLSLRKALQAKRGRTLDSAPDPVLETSPPSKSKQGPRVLERAGNAAGANCIPNATEQTPPVAQTQQDRAEGVDGGFARCAKVSPMASLKEARMIPSDGSRSAGETDSAASVGVGASRKPTASAAQPRETSENHKDLSLEGTAKITRSTAPIPFDPPTRAVVSKDELGPAAPLGPSRDAETQEFCSEQLSVTDITPETLDPELLPSASLEARPVAKQTETQPTPPHDQTSVLAKSMPQEDPAGTGAAKIHGQMSYAEKIDKPVGDTEQFLPPATFSADLARKFAAGKRQEGTVEGSAVIPPATTTANSSFGSEAIMDAPWATAEAVPGSRVAAQTLELVTEQAVRLQNLKADSLSLVLRPDSQTELYLELRMRDGQIDVRAQLHRGDFDVLNSHWSDLQSKLGQQGVRLAALTQDTSSPWAGTQDHSHSRREPLPTPWDNETKAAVPLRPATVKTIPLPRLATPRRGLELYV
jgi:hypothetical protein